MRKTIFTVLASAVIAATAAQAASATETHRTHRTPATASRSEQEADPFERSPQGSMVTKAAAPLACSPAAANACSSA